MLEPQPQTPGDGAITGEDMTIRPSQRQAKEESIGATEEQFVPVDGPRSGDKDQGGTQDEGINPRDEITPG